MGKPRLGLGGNVRFWGFNGRRAPSVQETQ